MKLAYMLDTNVCIHVMRNSDSAIIAKLDDRRGKICISSVALHELFHGANRSNRPEHERAKISALISLLEVRAFDEAAAKHSGNIHATLAQAGKIIGPYDMLIAGHARSLGLTIVTNNLKEFTRVEGLSCEDWL